MNILVSNDDGYKAKGIKALVKTLHEDAGADIFVFAPDSQRSGAGHAISLHGTVDMWPVDFAGAEAAFALNGTPADCVAIGLEVMKEMGVKADMVFSGINHGSNLGTDTIYSGTVACALEGAIQGVPSVAVSVDSTDPTHFGFACRLAVETIRKTAGSWNPEIMLNINSPDLPEEEIKGVCHATLGEREYTNDIQKVEKKGKVTSFTYGGEAVQYDSDDLTIDVVAIQNGYATIATMHKDLTALSGYEMLEKWQIGR